MIQTKAKIQKLSIELEEKDHHPMADFSFYRSLDESGVLGVENGWEGITFESDSNALYGFKKHHSYGEYIFDWAWANAYTENSLNYYPKLLHMTPFTPVNAPKIYGAQSTINEFTSEVFNYYQSSGEFSGHHYLFINEIEQKALENHGYHIRHSLQYHLPWRYDSFEEFLDGLRKNKRKNIKKERRAIDESGLQIQAKSFLDVTEDEIDHYYLLYQSTIMKKYSHAYLTRETFLLWQKYSAENITVIEARKGNELIAMSLFFHSKSTLYGRYWGIKPHYEQQYPFLHFELCYYRGMDLCVKNNLSYFEAGAQGEHKLIRGFEPVIIKSAHHLRMAPFHQAIGEFIHREKRHLKKQFEHLRSFLPYKSKETS